MPVPEAEPKRPPYAMQDIRHGKVPSIEGRLWLAGEGR